MVADKCEQLYRLDQPKCEGCTDDLPSQWDHTCVWISVQMVMDDHVEEYYEEALRAVEQRQVVRVANAVIEMLGVGLFFYIGMDTDMNGLVKDTLRDMQRDLDLIVTLYEQTHSYLNTVITIEDRMANMDH